MIDELSDEAFWEWNNTGLGHVPPSAITAWRECRRRAEVLIEMEKRKAFEAGANAGDAIDNHIITIDEAYLSYTKAAKERKE